MSYRRVIPRDLFNEAKLLKCLGQVALFIHEGRRPFVGWTLTQNDDGPFVIDLDPERAELWCWNLELLAPDGVPVEVSTPVNSRAPWPLQFIRIDGSSDQVFTDDGQPSPEFIAFAADRGVTVVDTPEEPA